MLLPQVVASSKDLSRFRNIVSLVGFSAFKTAVVALENINNISEGMVSEHLQDFLNSCVPKSKTVTLGIADTKLGANITEALGIKCDYTNVILEIIRGIRCHFPNLVKGLTSQSVTVAQLGLAHSYSRAKVKFNVNRVDNMIIQSINLMDQLDKDLNLFSMRIRYVALSPISVARRSARRGSTKLRPARSKLTRPVRFCFQRMVQLPFPRTRENSPGQLYVREGGAADKK